MSESKLKFRGVAGTLETELYDEFVRCCNLDERTIAAQLRVLVRAYVGSHTGKSAGDPAVTSRYSPPYGGGVTTGTVVRAPFSSTYPQDSPNTSGSPT